MPRLDLTPNLPESDAEMKYHKEITLERISQFISRGYYSKDNLVSCLNKKSTTDGICIAAYEVPALERIPFEQAVKQEFKPAKVGDSFGPTWKTIWFKIEFKIPDDWDFEDAIELHWDSEGEAMIFSEEGIPLQGLYGGDGWDRRVEYRMKNCSAGKTYKLYVEMACNGMFGAGKDGLINPPDPDKTYKLRDIKLVVIDELAIQLYFKYYLVAALSNNQSSYKMNAIQVANQIINTFEVESRDTWSKCIDIAEKFVNCLPRDISNVIAIGHCHIDTAWLWPYAETRRKCARSWVSQLRLMELYPEYKFACSQAQQYQWLEQDYPKLFQEIKLKIESGQFIPVGSTWVEMDCNIPSGESFIRQFLYGQRYFKSQFGEYHEIFWLPDTFGYSAQLPQVMKLGGAKYFLTQKLSWNNINKFPHTTFMWEGLDGTRVMTHFPPSNTYNAQGTMKEIFEGISNHKDKDVSPDSLLVFGHGDGGGGPTREMLDRISAMSKCGGLPSIKLGGPSEFFKGIEPDCNKLPRWRGELYFELHRGTYTSQALNKKCNRRCEYLLRDSEQLSVLAQHLSAQKFVVPQVELENAWKKVLLNQFHDVLPGSSIGMVYEDSSKLYLQVEETAKKATGAAIDSIKTSLDEGEMAIDASMRFFVFNTTQFHRDEVVEVECNGQKMQSFVSIEGFSGKYFELTDLTADQVTVRALPNARIQMHNENLEVTLDTHGQLLSLCDKKNDRNIIHEGEAANVFKIFDDKPIFWDAWDVEVYHLQKHWNLKKLGKAEIIESGPLIAAIKVEHQISENSKLIQIISLKSSSAILEFETSVEWNERHKFLKVEFPFDIRSDYATYETAYGVVQRPTHYNTSWDLAKFEVCAHKFADLSEHNYGVALLNDCKYGYSCHDNIMRLSLLRSPKAPDENCDIGAHTFKYALYPHSGCFADSQVVKKAYNYNVPLIVDGLESIQNSQENVINTVFKIDKTNIIIDCIKKAEDSNKLILRMYEAYGGKTKFELKTSLPVKSCELVDGLERHIKSLAFEKEKHTLVSVIKPFEVMTLMFDF